MLRATDLRRQKRLFFTSTRAPFFLGRPSKNVHGPKALSCITTLSCITKGISLGNVHLPDVSTWPPGRPHDEYKICLYRGLETRQTTQASKNSLWSCTTASTRRASHFGLNTAMENPKDDMEICRKSRLRYAQLQSILLILILGLLVTITAIIICVINRIERILGKVNI